MSGTPEQQDLSSLLVACPLCHQVHERCIFTAGSVYCTRPLLGGSARPPAAIGPPFILALVISAKAIRGTLFG